MQKTLIIIGVLIFITGLLWSQLSKLPFFKLPGDIVIDKTNFKIFIPITTMAIFSLLLMLIIWVVRKFF